MMKKLIINADDFALHPSINAAIVQAHREGILTSASILATGKYLAEAVNLAKQNPKLSLGAHLCLVGGLQPVTDIKLIPSLVNSQTNCFYDNYMDFTKFYFLGKIKLAEIHLELANQVKLLLAHGISLSHLDSHQHLHVLPGINQIVINLARDNCINKVRVPAENYFFSGEYPFTLGRFFGRGVLSAFAQSSAKHFSVAGISYPQNFFGMLAGGNLQEKYLFNILRNIEVGTNEIMIHPGLSSKILDKSFAWKYNWELEFQALMSKSLLALIREMDIQLISFKDL